VQDVNFYTVRCHTENTFWWRKTGKKQCQIADTKTKILEELHSKRACVRYLQKFNTTATLAFLYHRGLGSVLGKSRIETKFRDWQLQGLYLEKHESTPSLFNGEAWFNLSREENSLSNKHWSV